VYRHSAAYKKLLIRLLFRKKLDASNVSYADELIFGLQHSGEGIDSLIHDDFGRCLVARYYFVKGDDARALSILAPVLQKREELEHSGSRRRKKFDVRPRLLAIGLVGTFLATDHPVALAVRAMSEFEAAMAAYQSGSIFEEMTSNPPISNVYSGLYSEPVDTKAVDQVMRRPKE
jgi:hypothetical protein